MYIVYIYTHTYIYIYIEYCQICWVWHKLAYTTLPVQPLSFMHLIRTRSQWRVDKTRKTSVVCQGISCKCNIQRTEKTFNSSDISTSQQFLERLEHHHSGISSRAKEHWRPKGLIVPYNITWTCAVHVEMVVCAVGFCRVPWTAQDSTSWSHKSPFLSLNFVSAVHEIQRTFPLALCTCEEVMGGNRFWLYWQKNRTENKRRYLHCSSCTKSVQLSLSMCPHAHQLKFTT